MNNSQASDFIILEKYTFILYLFAFSIEDYGLLGKKHFLSQWLITLFEEYPDSSMLLSTDQFIF